MKSDRGSGGAGAPKGIPVDLVLRAEAHFEARVAELAAHDAAVAAYAVFDSGGTEEAAELAVKAVMARAIEQARRETVSSLRALSRTFERGSKAVP